VSDIKEIVRENVRKLRIAKKISQHELAKRTGLTVRYVNRVENHPQNISIEQLERIAEGLDVAPETLIVSEGRSLGSLGEHILLPLEAALLELEKFRALIRKEQPKP
jgi:transcriptional regulator with XRE-family HTH domain